MRDLQEQLDRLHLELEETRKGKETVEGQLLEATATLAEQTTALAAAQAAAAANQANQPLAAAENNHPTVLRPVAPRGGRIKIQQAMGLDDKEYKSIQRHLHKLCHASGLDWTKDFRLQSPESLALLYRAARKEHPILKTYESDWATAEIVKMYFQNARNYARRKNYLAPAPARRNGRGRANQENRPARSVRGVGAAA